MSSMKWNYLRGEGIPVCWQYPQTPGDINPYLITLKKVNTANYYKRNDKTHSCHMKKKPTKSRETCNTRNNECYVESSRKHNRLDTPYNSTQEFNNRSMAKVDDDSNQRFQLVYNRAEHPTLKNFHQTRCNTCYNEKKQEKYYSKNAIRRLCKLLDTPCNSNLEYLPKEIHTKKGSHDRKEYCSLEKMQTSCKACAHDKRNHNYYTLLTKEFQKLKNDIEELKLTVLSIKNECSNCNHIKRKNELKNRKKNSKYKRIRILK